MTANLYLTDQELAKLSVIAPHETEALRLWREATPEPWTAEECDCGWYGDEKTFDAITAKIEGENDPRILFESHQASEACNRAIQLARNTAEIRAAWLYWYHQKTEYRIDYERYKNGMNKLNPGALQLHLRNAEEKLTAVTAALEEVMKYV